MEKSSRVYVAGCGAFIGSAIVQELERQGYRNIISRPGEEPDLTDGAQVDAFFARTSPEYVFDAAGSMASIEANQRHPAELMLDNLLIACHVVQSSYSHGVKKLLYLASSCTYPRHCPQPMRVESLMSGPMEATSEAYSTAKIAGIKLCQAYRQQYGANFISAIPANPFGPGDDFDLENAHVIGALIRKMHEAKQMGAESVEVWGTGTPRRYFIFVDDLADACIFVMQNHNSGEPINLGTGTDISINELASLIKEIVGYEGGLRYDTSKPDGAPMKLLDSAPLRKMGWDPKISFREALSATYGWFLKMEWGDVELPSEPILSREKGRPDVQ